MKKLNLFIILITAICAVLFAFEPPNSHIGSHPRILPTLDTIVTPEYTRTSIFLPSHGLQLHAWLYLPHQIDQPPLILAAHGFACQKDFVLDSFAKDFTIAGFAVFTFDYRYFGGSEGEPRQLIEVPKLLEDWHVAVDYVLTNLTQINNKKIGIWGTSFSGGHVIQVGSTHTRKERIGAIVSQVPFTDGMATASGVPSYRWLGWMILFAIKDMLRNLFDMPRYYVDFLGKPEDPIPSFFSSPRSNVFYDIVPGGEKRNSF